MAPEWPVRESVPVALLVTAIALLALLACFANGLQMALQWLIAPAIVFAAAASIRRRLRPGIRSLRIDGDRLLVRDACGLREVRLGRRAFVSPFFIGIRWQDSGGFPWPRALGIFRDQMADGDFRRLSAALRQRNWT